MSYSMYLALVMATFSNTDSAEQAPSEADLDDKLEPILQRLRQLLRDFTRQPGSPTALFQLEQQLQTELRELGRLGLEWTLNHLEPAPKEGLPLHVHFEAAPHTRLNAKTPQDVATLFGKIRWWRTGYRPTNRTGDPTIFPLAQPLGIVQGATPALAEKAARCQAETGATQRHTLQRLKREHGIDWGVKKLRQVTDHVAEAMTVHRPEVQVAKLLELLGQASASTGRHRPVVSVGRDGITFGLRDRKGTPWEVASTGTISVLDRRGRRLGTIYLAFTPEAKQTTMTDELTRVVQALLAGWEGPAPRWCYVTDAGANETAYYRKVLRRLRHPRTGERLEWFRVVDYYHASERLWTMGEALFGNGPRAKRWPRRMQKLLLEPNGVRRVLASAAALQGRYHMTKKAAAEFRKAYAYLCKRTKTMNYARYRRLGIPLGSGVTEAGCKTIYTQRLKLSGMQWKDAGAQTILNLRVLLLSRVWNDAYQRVLQSFEEAKVPSYDGGIHQTVDEAA